MNQGRCVAPRRARVVRLDAEGWVPGCGDGGLSLRKVLERLDDLEDAEPVFRSEVRRAVLRAG